MKRKQRSRPTDPKLPHRPQAVPRPRRRRKALGLLLALAALLLPLALVPDPLDTRAQAALPDNRAAQDPFAVLGYSELGMHCMNRDFSSLCVLPPFNTMFVEIIDRSGSEPHVITSGVDVSYSIPGNTRSYSKTDFWDYAAALFGKPFERDAGLTGSRLTGTMTPTGTGRWSATGIPMTPITDAGKLDPYQKMRILVRRNGVEAGRTQPVIPVSWEMSCNLCHNTPGISADLDILRAHDRRHGTHLEASKPVLCASCHSDNVLGAPGQAGVSSLSHAMHGAHASRMSAITIDVACYACHPGLRTRCQRDIHYAKGLNCLDCHGGMLNVADANRRPWLDEPRCDSCHQRTGFEFEQPGTLYRESRGHHGIHCAACHNSPHAITPTIEPVDNPVAVNAQGRPGTLNTCAVCHRTQPDDPFDHRYTPGGD